MDADLLALQSARDRVRAAVRSQAHLGELDQRGLDAIVAAMAQAAEQEAERLGQLAHDETGFGNPADKRLKNLFSARQVHEYIKPLKTVGVLREDPSRGLIEIACPKGVVAAIIPSTNPTSTTIFKALIALKAGCSIVFSPHPAARGCIIETTRVLSEAALGAGAPEGALGCIDTPSERATEELMRHRNVGVILATGGMGLVRAAYSAGKPAYGVGPGNVPAFIERTADVAKAVKDVITGTTFDYGTICSSEQALVVDRPVKDAVVTELKANGAYFLNPDEVERLGPLLITRDGRVNPSAVGRPAPVVAALAGLSVPAETTVLVGELDRVGKDVPLSLEKLSPVLALYTEDGWERACERCIEILSAGGLGHTMAIHSRDERIIRAFGLKKPVFRIIVNSPTTHGAIGYSTALAPSMTLGCGALGGNITSDNITPLHLIDVKRLAWEVRPVRDGESVPQQPLAAARRLNPAVGEPAPAQSPSRQAVETLVDRFLGVRRGLPARTEPIQGSGSAPPPAPGQASPPAARPRPTAPSVAGTAAPAARPPAAAPPSKSKPPNRARKGLDFVCEEDVRRALAAGETLYVDRRAIITPAARDLARGKSVLKTVG